MMTLQIELWQLITVGASLCLTVIGGYWTLVNIIVKQFKLHLDQRFKVQEQARTDAQATWETRFGEVNTGLRQLTHNFTTHLLELPEKYQRREDAIRQEVTIINRLDGLASLVEQKFVATDRKIEGLRRKEQ